MPFFLQERPYLSEITPAQVLVGYEDDLSSEVKIGMLKGDFVKLLERQSDWQFFVKKKLRGKHISGNHRWRIKSWMYDTNRDVFEENVYWNVTITQIYAGCTNWQTKYGIVIMSTFCIRSEYINFP